MNKKYALSLSITVSLMLAGCGGGTADPATAPLAGAKMGGAFNLIDQNGKPISDQAFKGKFRIIYFGYTFCPDVCPTDVQVISQGLSVYEKADKARAINVVPVFISVDPKRDTPAAVKSFVSNFHPRLVGLTGTEAEIARVAKAYGIYFELAEPNSAGGYLVNHSNFPVLYDPDGKPLEPIPVDKGSKAVAEVLARWAR